MQISAIGPTGAAIINPVSINCKKYINSKKLNKKNSPFRGDKIVFKIFLSKQNQTPF
jgi:hypothetical protein